MERINEQCQEKIAIINGTQIEKNYQYVRKSKTKYIQQINC